MANKIYVNNIIEKTGGGAVVAGSNVSYTVPSNSAANIGSVDNIKAAIDWILINWPSDTVPTVKTLSSISWTGGSVNPTSVTSGGTVTLTKGTITANYSDGTTSNVTSSTSFTVNNGASINGTTITAPTVTSNTQVTVTAQYTENGVSKTATKTFSVVPQSTTTYYWYAGTTQITSDNYQQLASQVTSYNTEYSVTVESRSFIYILVAANKTVTLIEPTLNAPIDLIEMTDVNIPDHKVYRTGGKCMGENIPIRIS